MKESRKTISLPIFKWSLFVASHVGLILPETSFSKVWGGGEKRGGNRFLVDPEDDQSAVTEIVTSETILG